jgi:hypothetical protein
VRGLVAESQGDASRTGRTAEVVAAVLGFLLGFGLSQPIFCVTGVNGAAHTECQNLLMMSFRGTYVGLIGFLGGICGAVILGTGVALTQRIRERRSSSG